LSATHPFVQETIMRCLVAVVLCLFLGGCAALGGGELAAFREVSESSSEREQREHPSGIYQRAQARRSVGGAVPHDALVQAWQQKEQMLMVDDLGAPVQWQWLGPGNIGGRLRAVLIDPSNPQRIWVGA